MNDDEFAERPSGFMLGKEFIIVLVIFFSGLSFTLGYFVGKNGTPKPEPTLQPVEPSAQVQKQELPPAPPSLALAPEPVQTQAVLPPMKEPVSQSIPITEKSVQQKIAESQIEKPVPEKSAQKIEPASALETKSAVYTVQIGAFRNIAEAKHLKAKFDKKGYKSFISEGKNKKAQKIFKVKIGEFREKKEAEVLALKLRKIKDLQTYVTLKTE